ncbi:PilT protein domain protein [Rippkaea orientalis PCC 8801]|uniref:PilT protein domain protein n=1 Tax=Rippkaea orientalis (strain PCC 8801 / RF-1) TaxID=41431 RepID=B7JVW9_RIPO1|nr:type II toxin-antitoxin system VapC family toxin [Rippkaea orientalis]ACK65658.1 PilT protein domain protein [Rippkaea orientalis PCC 8801]
MYILDTDHISILQRGGVTAEPLRNRLAKINPNQVGVTIITYEEQLRGWLNYITKSKTIAEQVQAYKKLNQQVKIYCKIPIFEFNEEAAQQFERLRKIYRKLGTMDLKIASVVMVNKSVLLTRNNTDFKQILDLLIEDWSCK